jgi:hypothetical protein
MVDESLQRTNSLLIDVQTSESVCEQLREQNQTIRNEYDQLLSVKNEFSFSLFFRNSPFSFRLDCIRFKN